MKHVVAAVLVAVAALVIAGALTHTAEAAPAQLDRGYHVVRPGETLFCIGRGYHVNPWAIAYRNGLVNPNRLLVGQTLAIPAAPWWYMPGPTCPPQWGPPPPPPPPVICRAWHTVLPGQTLYRISLMYGVPMGMIVHANGIVNPNYIQAYQRLCIP